MVQQARSTQQNDPPPDKAQLREQAQRPGIAALSVVGWLEIAISLVFLVLGLPYIAIAFGAASIVMGTIANKIRSSGRWYDREAGEWRDDGPPPPQRLPSTRSPVFIANVALSGALLIGAGAAALAFGALAVAVALSVYAIAVTVLLSRFR